MEELGSGFYLAMHDLESAGAARSRESQSGEHSRRSASRSIPACWTGPCADEGGKAADVDDGVDISTEVNLPRAALLPETYCSDVHERLSLYKAPRRCETREELEAMQEELVDPLRSAARPGPRAHPVPRGAPRGAGRSASRASMPRTRRCSCRFVKNPPLDATKVLRLHPQEVPPRASRPTACASTSSSPPGRSAPRR